MNRRLWILIPLAILVSSLLAGCQKQDSANEHVIYYLNLDATCVQEEELDEEIPTNTDEAVNFLMEKLQGDPKDSKLRKTIPDGITWNIEVMKSLVRIDFSEEYRKLEPTEEILVRAAVVKTLDTNIESVAKVSFKIGGELLTDIDGSILQMSADSFVENTGDQINTKIDTELTLYYVNSTGDGLVETTSVVSHSTNKSMEKVVIEKLMVAPKSSDIQTAIPAGTNLINITVVDDICYVNFDDTFLNNQTDLITEEAMVYSIVNSLCSLENVQKVQIQVSGMTEGVIRYNYSLAETYEKNETLVVEENDTEAATESAEGTEEQ